MPRHLVAPIHERTPIPALLAQLREAHGFLVEQARQTVPKLGALPPERWGIAAKRVYVELPADCNPTTSSAPLEQGRKTEADHDLVLVDREGARWSFEVSDVASERDGNGKEKKDLASLGIPMAEGEGWPPGRCFLVVSAEFAERLRKPSRHGLGRGVFHYVEHTHGTTTLFEVCRGRG